MAVGFAFAIASILVAARVSVGDIDTLAACIFSADKREAIRACTTVIDAGRLNTSNLAWALSSRGTSYYASGDHEKALQDLDRAIELKPDDPLAYTSRGFNYFDMNKFDLALADFNRALELRGDLALAHLGRGSTYGTLGKYRAALADFDTAIQEDPSATPAYVNRGKVHFLLLEYDRAIEDFDHAVTLEPGKAQTYALRAIVYFDQRQYKHAIADYTEAITLEPEDGNYWNSRCWTRAVWGRELNTALADCEKSVGLAQTSDNLDSLGFVHFRLGRYREAIADMDRALSLKPNSASSLFVRGLSKLRSGDRPGGSIDINAAKSVDPAIAETYAAYGVKP